MSRKKKLIRFSENARLPNVFENFDARNPQITNEDGEVIKVKGNWHPIAFGEDQPIVLELACGRGEYTLAMARDYPEFNFIGVDIKGARIWKGAKTSHTEGLSNVCFLRSRIEQLSYFFEESEVSEIWITFPDPFNKQTKANRRLTSPNFLDLYRSILKPDGRIHLKTDSDLLYNYTYNLLEKGHYPILESNTDIYSNPLSDPRLRYRTYYENMHLENEKTIKHLCFSPFPSDPA